MFDKSAYKTIITFKQFKEMADNMPELYVLPHKGLKIEDDTLGIVNSNYWFQPVNLCDCAKAVVTNEQQKIINMYKNKKNDALDKYEKLRDEMSAVLKNNEL